MKLLLKTILTMKKEIYLTPQVEFLPSECEEAIAMSDLNIKPRTKVDYDEEEDLI